ncbi:hypothetical protein FV242_22850 [Methylobacterium sp. WL64]|uniref:hypothetical protein n=1 Tax=Methylobacterium sp. WL64 TaxID=2603894 RepID=UPI0011C85CAF|nr:hypothetical protein [Methylobacterium sp. WL64]TXN00202.1 hypothetical protein FV242_22850 [Methylobacterium sp. WL64]
MPTDDNRASEADELMTIKIVAIGMILFRAEKDEICRSIDAIKAAANRCTGTIIKIYIKWNSEPTFSLGDIINNVNISIEILSGDFNDGFGAAHNKMMEKALEKADAYICLNPDGFLHPDSLASLVKLDVNLPNPALIEAIQFPREHPKPYDPFTGLTAWCSGACLYISKRLYTQVGGFDENIFMYCEDIDLSWRVRNSGYKCFVCVDAFFYHEVREKKSALVDQLMFESARYLSYKWGADGFTAEMERLLVERNFYPTADYLPPLPEVSRIPSKPGLQEWRQLLSFAIPRWH